MYPMGTMAGLGYSMAMGDALETWMTLTNPWYASYKFWRAMARRGDDDARRAAITAYGAATAADR